MVAVVVVVIVVTDCSPGREEEARGVRSTRNVGWGPRSSRAPATVTPPSPTGTPPCPTGMVTEHTAPTGLRWSSGEETANQRISKHAQPRGTTGRQPPTTAVSKSTDDADNGAQEVAAAAT